MKDVNIVFGNWEGVRVCSSCRKELNLYDIIGRNGVCKHCGAQGPKHSGMVPYDIASKRKVYKVHHFLGFIPIKVFKKSEYK